MDKKLVELIINKLESIEEKIMEIESRLANLKENLSDFQKESSEEIKSLREKINMIYSFIEYDDEEDTNLSAYYEYYTQFPVTYILIE